MKDTEKRPEIVVFAGPNGSGKSTFTELLRPLFDYINADEIKKNLQCSDLDAAKLAERQREEHIEKGLDFCFETVLSTRRNLDLLKKAKEKGYFVRCYYILTEDPIINVFRVKSRVLLGGHDVPVDKIISRYHDCLRLMKEVIETSDVCHVYDNSTQNPIRIFKKRKTECFFDDCESWSAEKIAELTGTSDAVKKNLNVNKG